MNEISYIVSVPDLEAFAEHELRTTYRGRILRQSAISALLLAVLTYVFLNSQFHHRLAALSVAVPMALLFFYALPGVSRDQHRKAIRRLYAGATDTALGPHTLSVDGDQLVVVGAHSESRVAWPAICRVATTQNHAFILLGPGKAIIVPLSQLPSASRQDFLNLLASRGLGTAAAPAPAA